MYEKELQIAIRAVKKAEPMFRKYFGTRTRVQKKSGDHRNLVSLADKKIEIDLKRFLLGKLPKAGFIGEESGGYNEKAEFVWALDPIDGTSNYLHGLQDCTISLALLHNNKPVLGAVFAPYIKNIYTASKGSGAFLNGKTMKVSRQSGVETAFGVFGWGKDINFASKFFPKLVKTTFKIRIAGSVALALCQVANGNFDFFAGKKVSNLWDVSAGQIILEEAGGVFVYSKDPEIQIAANKTLADKLLNLLR